MNDESPKYRGVLFQPLRCPRCRSKRVPVQHTGKIPRVDPATIRRHHKCLACDLRFPSAETVLDIDRENRTN
jgi:transcriptional regulator NrdR family protein